MIAQNARSFYHFVDRPVSGLGSRHALLLRCIRIWARGAMARTCPLRLVAPRFVLAGHAETLVPFHGFMITFGNAAARAIGLSAREDGPVTDDEALILTALENAQNASIERAKLAFASFVHGPHLDAVTHKALLLMQTTS